MVKPKLTPEEKKALKAQKKMEKKLRAEEAVRQQKRDHLTRELKYGELSYGKLKEGWKRMSFDIHLPELHKDFQIAVNSFENSIGAKDFIISLLMDELDAAENQYNFNFQSHCENIYDTFNLYLRRLNDLKRTYDLELNTLQKDYTNEIDRLMSRFKDMEEYLKLMIYQLGVEKRDTEDSYRTNTITKKEEMYSRFMDDFSYRREKGENVFASLWRGYVNTINDYFTKRNVEYADYNKMKVQDANLLALIKKQTNDIMKCQMKIKNLKDKQANEKELYQIKIDFLNKQRTYFANIVCNLKKKLEEDEQLDKKNLQFLVLESSEVLKHLFEICEFGEQILRLYSVIRKYENLKEKILPFPKFMPTIYDRLKVQKEETPSVHQLGNFWKKYAKASISRVNVLEELKLLKINHEHVKFSLKNCLNPDCVIPVPTIISYNYDPKDDI